MKVVITGAAGMVGGCLSRSLAGTHEVVGLRREDLDLLDPGAVRTVLTQLAPDVVIHAAGRVGGIEANRRANSTFLVENTLMGFHLVRGARDAGVGRVLNLSSSCIYPRDRELLHEEDILTGPLEATNQGYALAKISVMYLCQALTAENEDVSYKTFIPCNLYGPGDHYELERAHLVPSAIRKVDTAVRQGLPQVSIWGDGSARREFMYVGDLADAVARALDDWEATPDLMNVGTGDDRSVTEYYRAVARALGYHGGFVFEPERPTGMRRKLLDISRATDWGWSPTTSLQDGLDSTLRDYRARFHD